MIKYNIREDHIGIFENYFDEEIIDSYLKVFKKAESENLVVPRHTHLRNTSTRLTAESIQDSSQDLITSVFTYGLNYINKPFIDTFFNKIYPIYAGKYSLLQNLARHSIFDIKIQKTVPGEGYHLWHCENGSSDTRDRMMAFSLYLKDVHEGGETEFLYQKFRCKPKRNTFIIWPAGYTHAHRGNPPLSNDKYIITGWLEYGSWLQDGPSS